MSSGYSAGYADVVDEAFVAKICPKEYNRLTKMLNADGETMDGFALKVQQEEVDAEIFDAFMNLVNAFELKTKLSLNLGYQDEDHGDSYDDVRGAYWVVDGVYQKTRAGKKYSDKIQRAFFVSFG